MIPYSVVGGQLRMTEQRSGVRSCRFSCIGFFALLVAAGCSGEQTPHYTRTPPGTGGSGGTGGVVGIGGSGGISGAGATAGEGGSPGNGSGGSGGSSGAPSVGDGIFDKDEVYFFGGLVGSNSHLGVASWQTPSRVHAGFRNASIKRIGTDGRLVYVEQLDTDVDWNVRVFTADPWSVNLETQEVTSYPDSPEDNDAIVASCEIIGHLQLDPVTDEAIRKCNGGTRQRCDDNPDESCGYIRSSGEPVRFPVDYALRRVGFDGHLLISSITRGFRVMDSEGTLTDPVEFAGIEPLAPRVEHLRAVPSGFLLLLDEGPWGVWEVDFDGSATFNGGYPANDTLARVCVTSGKAANDIFCFENPGVGVAVVNRYVRGAPEPEQIYINEGDPLLQVYGVVTGQ
jgi:hypothetical protein